MAVHLATQPREAGLAGSAYARAPARGPRLTPSAWHADQVSGIIHPLMKTFSGFAPGKVRSASIPDPFFTELVPLIDDLA